MCRWIVLYGDYVSWICRLDGIVKILEYEIAGDRILLNRDELINEIV